MKTSQNESSTTGAIRSVSDVGYDAKLDQCGNIVNSDANPVTIISERDPSGKPVEPFASTDDASEAAERDDGDPEYSKPW